MIRRHFFTLAASTLALGVALAGFSAPLAAQAAPGEIEVSTDGVNYGTAIYGSLFSDIAVVVPGDSQSAAFSIRNAGGEPGFVRVTLRDVTSSDAKFEQALSVTVNTPGLAGTAVSLDKAAPCWVLNEGLVLQPGQSALVQAGLVLGNLDGKDGQNSTAAFALGVELSSTSLSTLPPTECGGSSTVVPGVQGGPSGGGGGSAAGPGTGFNDPDPGAVTSQEDENVELPVLNLPNIFNVDPNTWRLFQEYFVLILLGAFVLGVIGYLLFAWLRRRRGGTDEGEVNA